MSILSAAVVCLLPGAGTPGHAEPLTIENARPMTVPAAPRLSARKTPAAPRPFVAPVPMEAPAPPALVAQPPIPENKAVLAPPSLPSSFADLPPVPRERTTASIAPAPAPSPAPRNAPVSELPAGPLRILFSAAGSDPSDGSDALLATLADRLQAAPSMRLQLRSYASGGGDSGAARRLSLSRALALRERLVALGVRSGRVDVRPLGTASEEGLPPDRIDIDVLNP